MACVKWSLLHSTFEDAFIFSARREAKWSQLQPDRPQHFWVMFKARILFVNWEFRCILHRIMLMTSRPDCHHTLRYTWAQLCGSRTIRSHLYTWIYHLYAHLHSVHIVIGSHHAKQADTTALSVQPVLTFAFAAGGIHLLFQMKQTREAMTRPVQFRYAFLVGE